MRVRFGIDADICSGDQACIRLSGCLALTLRAPVNPLRVDPITTITADCVGCGLCGRQRAQAAALCPSFYRVEVVSRPGALGAPWSPAFRERHCACCRRHEGGGALPRRPLTVPWPRSAARAAAS